MRHFTQDEIDFFVGNILHAQADEGLAMDESKISALQRQNIKKPIVYLGITTNSIVGGALETLKAIEEYIENSSIAIELVEVGGIGQSSFDPIMDVQLPGRCRISFRRVNAGLVHTILNSVLNNHLIVEHVLAQHRNPYHQPWPNIPFYDELKCFAGQHRVLMSNCGIINPSSIADAIVHGTYKAWASVLRNCTHEEVCDIIEKSGLRGRGGGGYSVGAKWRATLETSSDRKYFISNADESDPGTFKDRLLMESDPHLLIEGTAVGAYAIGANKAYIYTRNRYELACKRLELAISQAYELGLLGHNIMDSGYSLDISIWKGPGAYVCGEETALIGSFEGKRGMPTLKPPYPSSYGLQGKPTTVNNIETVANIPPIINKGYEWYCGIGTEKSRGTKLFSISGKTKTSCVVEVPLGTTVRQLLDMTDGWPAGSELKAVQMGGPSGGCIPPELIDTPIDYEVLWDLGLSLGSGGMLVYDSSVCLIDMLKYFMGFIQKESCGKCIPCREGSSRMLEILDCITRRPISTNGQTALERFKGVIHLEGLAEVIRDTSLCGLGQTAPNPALSTLKYFREEFEEHIFDRKCRASVCKNLRIFHIDVSRCTGCDACARKCPTNAIIGQPRSPYFVVEEKCIGCGICEEVCKFSAVFFK